MRFWGKYVKNLKMLLKRIIFSCFIINYSPEQIFVNPHKVVDIYISECVKFKGVGDAREQGGNLGLQLLRVWLGLVR